MVGPPCKSLTGVVLSGSRQEQHFVWRGEVSLVDAATGEPYHEVMELPWNEACVVGSAPRSLDRIGNQHIRAHAAEGILFRRVLEVASEHNPHFNSKSAFTLHVSLVVGSSSSTDTLYRPGLSCETGTMSCST